MNSNSSTYYTTNDGINDVEYDNPPRVLSYDEMMLDAMGVDISRPLSAEDSEIAKNYQERKMVNVLNTYARILRMISEDNSHG